MGYAIIKGYYREIFKKLQDKEFMIHKTIEVDLKAGEAYLYLELPEDEPIPSKKDIESKRQQIFLTEQFSFLECEDFKVKILYYLTGFIHCYGLKILNALHPDSLIVIWTLREGKLWIGIHNKEG